MPRSRIQRWTWLGFKPLARATPATETPGSRQAEITYCLTASLCVRRVRHGITTSMVSAIEFEGHDLQWAKQTAEGGFAGCLLCKVEVGFLILKLPVASSGCPPRTRPEPTSKKSSINSRSSGSTGLSFANFGMRLQAGECSRACSPRSPITGSHLGWFRHLQSNGFVQVKR